MSNEDKTMKEVLTRIMQETGITATNIHEDTKIKKRAVKRILNGEIDNPRVKTVQKIAKCLGIISSQLLGEVPITSLQIELIASRERLRNLQKDSIEVLPPRWVEIERYLKEITALLAKV